MVQNTLAYLRGIKLAKKIKSYKFGTTYKLYTRAGLLNWIVCHKSISPNKYQIYSKLVKIYLSNIFRKTTFINGFFENASECKSLVAQSSFFQTEIEIIPLKGSEKSWLTAVFWNPLLILNSFINNYWARFILIFSLVLLIFA